MNARLPVLVSALATLGASHTSLAEKVRNIVPDTDRSVNCATVKTIAPDVTAGPELMQLLEALDANVWLWYKRVPHGKRVYKKVDTGILTTGEAPGLFNRTKDRGVVPRITIRPT